jgi:long-chain acyl-CoA synthetase
VDADDVAVIIYTSGTTGAPKGAELRHRNLRDNAMIVSSVYGVTGERPESHLAVLPLFHIFGQSCMQNAAIAFGSRVVMVERFDPVEVLRTLVDERITIFGGVPTMYFNMLAAVEEARARGVDVGRIRDHLRVAASGGAAMAAELHERFHEEVGVRVLDGYGKSEASSAVASARVGEPTRVGTVGRPLPSIGVELIDSEGRFLPAPEPRELSSVGEVVVKGHGIMRGYRGRAEATEAAIRDGWFRTGDLGRRDSDGFLYIVDRLKDMIIRGGYSVYPREIEDLLMMHPAVRLVAVVGVPHESLGQEIKAVVVPRSGVRTSEEELRAWAARRLAAYKYPRIVEFRDELPVTASGEILKRDIA